MPAEEAIDILVNSYKSSNTSKVANQEMRYVNEMVSVLILRTKLHVNISIIIFSWYISQVTFNIFFSFRIGR